MRSVKLVTLAALTMFAFAAFGTAVASAEGETGILCLVANACEALESTNLKGKESRFETLNGLRSVTATAVTSTIKGCETTAEGKHIELCKDVPITFTGVKLASSACHSESEAGTDKEAAETVKFLLDLHMSAELTLPGEVLQPLLLAKALGVLLESNVFLTCALVKVKLLGVLACLILPGLKNIAAGGTVEILCKINSTTHDPETGMCEVLCKWLEEDPLMVSFNGATFEDAWKTIHLEGSFNKDVLLDD